MKLYRILYQLPGHLILTDGQKELRIDDLRDRTREIDGEYALAALPEGRRAIYRLDRNGTKMEPPVFVEQRKE